MISSFINFLIGMIELVIFVAVVIAVIAFMGYNKLRSFSESIKESWSNIGVVGRKQASLINQLIDVVKGYQESEKLVMLKVSEDMSNTSNVAQMYQQSGMVMSSVNGLAQKFPELKANQQYQRLIDSIQSCETQLESARAAYNRTVREYNTVRSSIPTVFYAPIIGFKTAPYLEFEGNNQLVDMGTLKSFSADDDGERINQLIGKAGSKLLEVSEKAAEASKAVAHKAIEGSKLLADKAQEKIDEIRADQQPAAIESTVAAAKKFCTHCGTDLFADAAFCSACGAKALG